MFQKNRQIGFINMFNTKKTLTQRFIENYAKLKAQNPDVNPEQLYEDAVELMKMAKGRNDEDVNDEASLSSAFREAQLKNSVPIKINIPNLFKQ